MAEKIILSADLYDNVLTEKPGDYTAKPQITGTLRNPEIADRIVLKRTEYRKETIVNILDLADQEKAAAIAEGKSLVDGVGQYMLTLSGPLEGEKPVFNPEIHKVGIMYTPGKVLLSYLKNITFIFKQATTGPVINGIIDSTTGAANQVLTPGAPAIISGSLLQIKGESPLNGVYFTEEKEGAAPQKVKLIVTNTISEIIVSLPALTNGKYRLSVTTQMGTGYKVLKEPRTYTFPILLTVGNDPGGDENPDIL